MLADVGRGLQRLAMREMVGVMREGVEKGMTA